MARRLALLFCAFLLAHSAMAAESLPAGFAPGQVWLSKSTPVAGETVEIYTVVYDASGTPIEGSVSFLIDGEVIGSSPFTLDAGETDIRSVQWTATEGTHELSARLATAIHAKTKEEANLRERTTGTTTITVLAPEPEPEPREARERTTPDIVTTALANPVLASTLAPFIQSAESIRTAGASLLEGYAAPTVATTSDESTGQVLGTATIASTSDAGPVSSIARTAANAALPLFSYPALFYPLVLIILALLFWLIMRRFRNPRRRRRR